MIAERRVELIVVALVVVALVIAFARVTPPGEAPDEPAHVRYVRQLANGELPSIVANYDFENYEAHQPPLGYVPGAIAWRLMRAGAIVFTPGVRLDFSQPGSRAVLPAITDAAQVRAIRVLRLAQLPFVLIAIVACWLLLRGNTFGLVYLLTPQLLFVLGAVNNDAAAIAFASLALLLLVRMMEAPSVRGGVWAGVAVALALFSKATTLFLFAPLFFVVLLCRHRKAAIALLATSFAGLAAWLALNMIRFGSLLPSVPSSDRGKPFLQLIAEPRWIGSLFRSFWAKFGWLNTPMAAPFYLWFAILTIAIAIGWWKMIRRPETHFVAALLTLAVAANLAFVLAFMVFVDWQPQGRYMLPSIGALAMFGTFAIENFPPRAKRAVTMTALVIALCVVIQGVLTVAYWYGRS